MESHKPTEGWHGEWVRAEQTLEERKRCEGRNDSERQMLAPQPDIAYICTTQGEEKCAVEHRTVVLVKSH